MLWFVLLGNSAHATCTASFYCTTILDGVASTEFPIGGAIQWDPERDDVIVIADVFNE